MADTAHRLKRLFQTECAVLAKWSGGLSNPYARNSFSLLGLGRIAVTRLAVSSISGWAKRHFGKRRAASGYLNKTRTRRLQKAQVQAHRPGSSQMPTLPMFRPFRAGYPMDTVTQGGGTLAGLALPCPGLIYSAPSGQCGVTHRIRQRADA